MKTGAIASGGNGNGARKGGDFERSFTTTSAQAASREGPIEGAAYSPPVRSRAVRPFKRERDDDGTGQPDTPVSLSDHPQGHDRARRRIQSLEEAELSRIDTPAYVLTDEASTVAALLRTRGQVPLTTNEESAIRLLRAGVQNQRFLSQQLAPSELMNAYGRDSVGMVPGPMFLIDGAIVGGGGMTRASSMNGYSGGLGALVPTSFPMAMDMLDPTAAILQRQQLLALSAGSPSILDYTTTGYMLPISSHAAPLFRAPAHQIGGSTIGDFEPTSIPSSSLADGDSRALAHLAGTMTELRSSRNEEVLGNNGQHRPVLPPLPPCEDGPLKHHSERLIVPLSTDEDENWLSEFLCFVRSDLTEVFRAGREDVVSRINSKKISYGQIGIRCRFCAHLPHSVRSCRSSSFPSSVSRIYQSLTMMLRDHFPRCAAIPEDKKKKFLALKAKTTQGATDSKRYWLDSATKLGMVDTPHGIVVTERTQMASLSSPPFGTADNMASVASSSASGHGSRALETGPPVLLVAPEDRELVSEYLFLLLSQVQRVHLTESERVGNRKNLEIGLPGLGCRHCCPTSRKGLCRLFPARRRTLPSRTKDLHDHLRRCTLCPENIKSKLSALKHESEESLSDNERQKYFFDRVWARMHREPRCGGESQNF